MVGLGGQMRWGEVKCSGFRDGDAVMVVGGLTFSGWVSDCLLVTGLFACLG